MPTYEYMCPQCGRFELSQGIKEKALETCPTCGNPVKRLISAGGIFLFKGSGFYTTDYRKPDYQKRQKEDQAKADAKPAAETPKGSGAAKDAGSKETGSKDAGSRETGSKDIGSKGAGTKDTGSKDAAPASKPSDPPAGNSGSGSSVPPAKTS
jgi:putative FmdB family regulatory protein